MSALKDHVIIGEGSYGCIHKPSLKCDKEKINYTNKVSKVFTKQNALDEYKNFEKINDIDKKEMYHTKPTTLCDVKDTNKNKNAISKCNNYSIYSKALSKIDELKLLVIDDNGINLEEYVSELKKMPINKTSTKKVQSLFIEMYTTIKGVQLFIENDIVHQDLKPSNLMYDKKKDKIWFIDFGLMDKISTRIDLSKKSKNSYGTCHWSYPFEASMYNANKYNSASEKKIFSFILKYFYGGYTIDEAQVSIRDECARRIEHIKTFLSFINYNAVHLNKYFHFMKEEILTDKMEYSHFIETSYKTFDIYGLGITFLYILHNLSKYITEEQSAIWGQLFARMVEPDVNKRIQIYDLLHEYEEKLFSFDYFTFTEKDPNKYIKNAKKGSLPTDIINKRVKIDDNIVDKVIHTESVYVTANCEEPNCNKISQLSNDKVKELVEDVVKEYVKGNKTKKITSVGSTKCKETTKCKEGKEMNPKTKRCIKVCNPGYVRNVDFKCVKEIVDNIETRNNMKQALEKVAKKEELKVCPDGKELNPKTNRCVNKCKMGYERNMDFKCVKANKTVNMKQDVIIHPSLDNIIIDGAIGKLQNKTHKNVVGKNMSKTEKKKCPRGKLLNPATNRCVNKCKVGEIRNDKFRCVKALKV